jgi:aminopeptidase N
MGPGKEFGVVYVRGPIAMHALRAELGDEKFSELMLSWIEEHAGRSASWADFVQLVTQLAGKDESAFLNAWFVQTVVPADQYLYPGKLHP